MNQPLVIDAADPLSLALVLPPELSDKVKDLPRELLIQDEETLTTMVRPSAQQKRIKIQFWDAYENAIKQNRVIILAEIIFGVCTREYFLEFVAPDRNLAWLVSPKPSYKLRVAELIERGLDVAEEILKMQPTPKNAISVRGLQLSALKMLDMRKHGAYTQRIEQKTLQKTIHEQAPKAATGVVLGEGSVEELEQQVRELEDKIAQGKNQNGSLLNAGQTGGDSTAPIDVTPGTES